MARTQTTKLYKGRPTTYHYLVCDNAKSGMQCIYKSVPYEIIESTFRQVLDHAEFYASVSGDRTADIQKGKLEILKGELVTVNRQIEKFTSLIVNDDKPSPSLVSKLKEFEAKASQLNREITLTDAQTQIAYQVPSHFIGIKDKMNKKLEDPAFRLRVREFIREFVESIKLDCEAKSYVVQFRNGHKCGVVFWCGTGANKNDFFFQITAGDKPRFDPDEMTFGGELRDNGNKHTGRPRGR